MFIDSFNIPKEISSNILQSPLFLYILASQLNFLLMCEIIKLKRVSVRNDAEACVTRLMCETWHLCIQDIF
jgi:hypothetical protein